jgi:hypothetical protein
MTMRFVMLTFVGPEHVDRWKAWSVDEKQADIAKHKPGSESTADGSSPARSSAGRSGPGRSVAEP